MSRRYDVTLTLTLGWRDDETQRTETFQVHANTRSAAVPRARSAARGKYRGVLAMNLVSVVFVPRTGKCPGIR